MIQRENTGLSVSQSLVSQSLVQLQMSPTVNGQTFQMCLLGGIEGRLRSAFKDGTNTFWVQWMSEALWTSPRVSTWQAGAPLKLSPLGSHGIWDPASSLTGWDKRNGWFMWGQEQILFIFMPLKNRSQPTYSQPFSLHSTVPSCLSFASFFPVIPQTWSIELSAFFPCSVLLWNYSSQQFGALVHKWSVVRMRNVRLFVWMRFGQSVWVFAFGWKR